MSATTMNSSTTARSPPLRAMVLIAALCLAATAAAAPGKKHGYKMIDLGTLPGRAMTMANFGRLHQRGQVIGWSYFSHYVDDTPFIWEKGVMRELDATMTPCGPQGLNEHGQIVGAYGDAQGAPHAFFHGAEGFVLLPLPEGFDGAWVHAINNRGTSGGGAGSPEFAYTFGRAPVVYVDGQPQVLPVLDLGFEPEPGGAVYAINDAEQSVGHSGGTCEADFASGDVCLHTHATLWEHGQPVDLGPLDDHPSSMAYAINNGGVVVGHSGVASSGASRAFVWSKKTGMVDLGMPSGWLSAWALGINDRGEIVGSVSEAGDPQFGFPSEYGDPPGPYVTRLNHAVLWKDGQCIDLEDFVAADSAWTLYNAAAINARGQILTWAAKANDGSVPGWTQPYIIHLILLDPNK